LPVVLFEDVESALVKIVFKIFPWLLWVNPYRKDRCQQSTYPINVNDEERRFDAPFFVPMTQDTLKREHSLRKLIS
jgi:hypothetical protein